MEKIYGCGISEYDAADGEGLTLCLGFFDCVHNGHKRVIDAAAELAAKTETRLAAFTFRGDPHASLGKDRKEIYTFRERALRMSQLGIDRLLYARPSESFFGTGAKEFLDRLFGAHDIRAVAAGSDYTFGSAATGNAAFLTEYCGARGVKCAICDMLEDAPGKKIASRVIEKLVEQGDVEKINSYLPMPYLIEGEVVHGRGEGAKFGCPTANILLPDDKLPLGQGVYATRVTVDGNGFPSVTNVGEHPTFSDLSFTVESHLIGWSGDLYGKRIAVEFVSRLRDIRAFSSAAELKAQIDSDIDAVLGIRGKS